MNKDPALKTTLAGVALACLSTTLGGMTVALTRLIIHDTDPLTLAVTRYGIMGLVFLGFMLAMVKIPRIPLGDLAGMTAIGVIMFAGFPYLMARALEDTTAARGALLFAAMPVLTIALSAAFRVERLTRLKAAAVLVAAVGTAIAFSENIGAIAPDALRGDAIMFAGMFMAAIFNVFSKRYLVLYGKLPVLVYMLFIGVGVLFAIGLAVGVPFAASLDFDATGWFVLFMLAIPGGAVMMYAWGWALQLVTPTQAAITIGLNPLTAILLGAWLLSEPITPRVLIGFTLLIAAIWLANRRAGVRPHSQMG